MPPVTKPKRQRRPHFIKEWRKYRNLTQAQVADRLDISRENYGRIENGKVPYNQDVLEALADALSCSVADLVVRNPLDPGTPWSLMESVAKAPPERRAQILAVIETLLKQAS